MITKAQIKTWVKALRSGEYKQAEGALCNSKGGMCCLGVLFDVVADDDWCRPDGEGDWLAGKDGEPWAGMDNKSHIPTAYLPQEDQEELASLNDETHWLTSVHRNTFDDIADHIEKKYL